MVWLVMSEAVRLEGGERKPPVIRWGERGGGELGGVVVKREKYKNGLDKK